MFAPSPLLGHGWTGVRGYPSLSSGRSHFVLATIGAAYTLPGLWHCYGLALAKGILEGAGLQENAGWKSFHFINSSSLLYIEINTLFH